MVASVVVVAAVALGACGSAPNSATGAGPGTVPVVTMPGADGLRKAARIYVQAWLTGSPAEIEALRSHAPCGQDIAVGPTGSANLAVGPWSSAQHWVQQFRSRPLPQVHISEVETRNVTATGGDAQVIFGVPEARAGNDNWLHYAYTDGHWQVDDCKLPFGGSSAEASAASRAR